MHSSTSSDAGGTGVSALQTQVGGDHYKDMAIQPVEYIMANNLGYCEANVVKYVSRWRQKGGVKDLEKAKHYLDLLIEAEAEARATSRAARRAARRAAQHADSRAARRAVETSVAAARLEYGSNLTEGGALSV